MTLGDVAPLSINFIPSPPLFRDPPLMPVIWDFVNVDAL
jgi:hypothetical protein